jgi:hypothetical protein
MGRVTETAAIAVLLLVAASLAGRADAATLRVPGQYATIHAAVSAARDGDTVLVAPGIYTESIDFSGKAITVTSEAGPDATTLDAGFAGSVVLFRSGEGRDSVLEGFELTGGTGTTLVTPTYGGAIYIESAAPTIRGNRILANTAAYGGGIACILGSDALLEGNEIAFNGMLHGGSKPIAGGGLFIESSSPEVVGNLFTDNAALSLGGAIAVSIESWSTIRHNTFERNATDALLGAGGAIGCIDSVQVLVEDNRIVSNSASLGAGLYAGSGAQVVALGNLVRENVASFGGGIALRSDAGSFFDGNRILDNSAVQGAGVYCEMSIAHLVDNEISGHDDRLADGGGVACVARSRVTLERNRITDNASRRGAGIWVSEQSVVTLERNHVLRNSALLGGGGLFSFDSIVELLGNAFVSNHSRRGPGGGLYFVLSEARLASDTVAGNRATMPSPDRSVGGGIFAEDTTIDLANVILWGNRSDEQVQLADIDSVVNVEGSLVEGGWPGEGNFDADPRFVDLAGDDVHLRIDSPCIDRGDEATTRIASFDLDGDRRSIDGNRDENARLDVGADEMRPEIAARFGAVHAAAGTVASVLRVDGSPGDEERVHRVRRREPISIRVLAPPAGPEPARFALYAWRTEPDRATITPLPHGLGVTGLPTPFAGPPINQPDVIWNNLGHRTRFGAPDRESSPAPSTLVELPRGLSMRMTVTIQGFIEDLASEADGPLSVTNAVVLEVTD